LIEHPAEMYFYIGNLADRPQD